MRHWYDEPRPSVRGKPTTAPEFVDFVASFHYERPDPNDTGQLERNVAEINELIHLARVIRDTEPVSGRRVCNYQRGNRPTCLEDWVQFYNEVERGLF